jgi:hypothetical protein
MPFFSMKISRRTFMKAVGAAAGGVATGGLTSLANREHSGNDLGMTRQEEKIKIRKYMADAKKEEKKESWEHNDAWNEGLEEYALRDEISSIIGEYTRVSYCRRPAGAFESEDSKITLVRRYGKQILEDNLPIENLCQIRDYLVDGPPNKNSIFMYLGMINV